MTIADFGSGSGHLTLALAQALEGSGHIYAIDVQRDLLRRIHNDAHKLNLTVVSTIWADLEYAGASKIADNYVDLVVISNMLFQMEDKAAVLREAARIVRPSGRVVIIDWTGESQGPRVGPHKTHVHPKSEARAAAGEVGLRFTREFDMGSHHYGLVFEK